MNNTIILYHEKRTILDYAFIAAVFDKDDRNILKKTQAKYPHSIIRMPCADLIANGYIKGLGGSVPLDHDGSVVQL